MFLERRTDAVIVPEALTPPLSVIEFQFGENPQIYTRTAQKMAAVQEEFDMREVQGIVFFGDAKFDPQTKPWTRIVRSIVLPDEVRRLAERHARASFGGRLSALAGSERNRIGTEGRGIFPHDQAQ